MALPTNVRRGGDGQIVCVVGQIVLCSTFIFLRFLLTSNNITV